MLKRVTADDDICIETLVLLRKEIRDELDFFALARASGIRPVAGIDALPRRAAESTKLTKELALAAADLQDVLACDCTLFRGLPRQRLGERIECAREVLRLLEIGRVGHHGFIENVIEDETAGVAIGKFQVATRETECLLGGIQKDTAMDWD